MVGSTLYIEALRIHCVLRMTSFLIRKAVAQEAVDRRRSVEVDLKGTQSKAVHPVSQRFPSAVLATSFNWLNPMSQVSGSSGYRNGSEIVS